MICKLLQTHWEMVWAMRRDPDPILRDCGARWLAARAVTLAPHPVQVKAIRYALRSFIPKAAANT